MVSALIELLREAMDVISYTCYIATMVLVGLLATFLLVFTIEVMVEVRRFRGQYKLLCPHRGVRACVKLHAGRAALSTAFSDEPVLQVRSCSLAATSSGCDQSCLTELRS